MKTQPKFGFAVEYVEDLSASRRFYTAVLGLEVEREHPTFVQFQNFALATDASPSGEAVELYWLVDDAEAAARELEGHTGIVLPVKQMPFGKVLRIDDPKGRPCFLLELADHRPSRELH
jgi:catechol 2,3-dioxygenase-like lactoylglutathione lyase family enzyme